jgi:hypothetical protein
VAVSYCGRFNLLYDFFIALAYDSIFVYWKSFSRKYFTFIYENQLHKTLFNMFPFRGDHLFTKSDVTVQIQHTVSSQDWGQRMYSYAHLLPFILYFSLSYFLLLFLHRCCLIPVAYSINRANVCRFLIILSFWCHSSTWCVNLVKLWLWVR